MIQDQTAERCILGSILIAPSKSLEYIARTELTSGSFAHADNRIIFDVMRSLHGAGKLFDITDVYDQLRDQIEMSYLEKMVDDTPTSENLPSYVAKALTAEKGRIVAHTLSHGLGELEGGSDPQGVAAGVTASLAGLEEAPVDNDCDRHIREREAFKTGNFVGVPCEQIGDHSMSWALPSYYPGDLIVVGGRSSDGKTTLMLNSVLHTAGRGIHSGVMSCEMPKWRLIERMASRESCINPMRFRSKHWTDAEAERFDRSREFVSSLPIHYCDDSDITMDKIEATAWMWRRRYDIGILYIDYLQLIRATAEEQRLGPRITMTDWSARLKGLAKRLQIPVYVLAQLRRTDDLSNGDVTPQLPTKEMLRESSSIENDADVVILIAKRPGESREEYSYKQLAWKMVLVLDKNRNGPTGKFRVTMFPSRYCVMPENSAIGYTEQIEEMERRI